MAGYDQKRVEFSHDGPRAGLIVEVDFLADNSWSEYGRFEVPAGESFGHHFPPGYSAHWVRLKCDRAIASATARFTYE